MVKWNGEDALSRKRLPEVIMKYAVTFAIALTVLTVGHIPPARAQAKKEDPLAEKVRQSIADGVKYLRDKGKSGDWENNDVLISNNFKGGQTSLALLALMNAGVPLTDPIVKNGLDKLREMKPTTTYAVSLQTMAFAQAGQNEDRERIQKNVDWLLAARMANGWTYDKERMQGGKNSADNSNTQYALLGLAEGRRAGAKVEAKVMKEIQKMYIDQQEQAKTGGWQYSSSFPGTRFTMTTAGVCGLLITGMNLEEDHKDLEADGTDPKCGKYTDNAPIARGMKWLSDRFPAHLDMAKVADQGIVPPFYCLYGLERCGRLSGQRFLGDKDWYRIGCEFLIENQNRAEGFWEGGVFNRNVPAELSRTVSTSFALLFLSKGRTPVLWTKFAWGTETTELGWNNKHNDARNVTEFASRELFKNQPMAWQVFDIRTFEASTKDSRLRLAEELLQSPIVFLSGHYLKLDDKQKDVLREYLANGGFIFAEACCNATGNGKEFDRDFTKLMKELHPDSELVDLPSGHALWSARYPLAPGKPFHLKGIQQGCKTVVVYSPDALAGYWEANKFEENDKDKDRGKKAFQLAMNVIAYATGMEPPKPKGYETPIVRNSEREKYERGYLKVLQLRYQPEVTSEWQPAPKAMRTLMEECRKVGLDVVPETKSLDLRDDNVKDYDFMYMHGRHAFKIPTKEELQALHFQLDENGGLLFAAACCGSKQFDGSFRKLMEVLLPDKKLEPIPLSDELYSKELNGVPIVKVRCRREAADGKPEAEFHNVAPALEGIKINGRWAVIYSKYDIGCALENSKASDCMGHDHDSAVLLAKAAVLYALKR